MLTKLGINPSERLHEYDQDAEYTTCRAEEVPRYFELYAREETTPDERALLCSYLLQGLNDLIAGGTPHPEQTAPFDALFDAGDFHRDELACWMDASEPDAKHWWWITAPLLAHLRTRRAAQT